jgi:hypothetical protein
MFNQNAYDEDMKENSVDNSQVEDTAEREDGGAGVGRKGGRASESTDEAQFDPDFETDLDDL